MSEASVCQDRKLGNLLTAYELGVLGERERAAVEEHLVDCVHCQNSLYGMAPFANRLRREPGRWRRVLDAGLAAQRPNIWQRIGAGLRSLLTPRVMVPVGAVAVLALVLVIQSPQNIDDVRELARIEAVPYVPFAVRGGDSLLAAADSFAAGMLLYGDQRYPAAARSLAAAVSAGQGDPSWRDIWQARFFRGLSLLLAGQAQDAVPVLAESSEAPLRPVAERSRWYLAQAYLQLDQPALAVAQLEQLVAASPVYGDQAAQLLAEIDRVQQDQR